MNLETFIESLNNKKEIQNIGLPAFDRTQFTDSEKAFFETFQPQNHLIIYGSLAPNAPNHHKVEHIKGEWKKGIVKGQLEEKGWGADLGYFAFRHTTAEYQKEIKAYILSSVELVDNWHYLDEFEGDGYKRILVSFELENGEIGVGCIYASND